MSNVRIAQITAALLAKGFVLENRDHKYFFFHAAGRKTSVFTFISHNERDADDWLLAHISRQLHLTKKELLALIECQLAAAEYLQILIDRGHLRLTGQ
jgi:hypothetical protein